MGMRAERLREILEKAKKPPPPPKPPLPPEEEREKLREILGELDFLSRKLRSIIREWEEYPPLEEPEFREKLKYLEPEEREKGANIVACFSDLIECIKKLQENVAELIRMLEDRLRRILKR